MEPMISLVHSIASSTLYKKVFQFIRFGLVGVVNFAVSWSIYSIVLEIFRLYPSGYHSNQAIVSFFFRWDYVIAGTIGFIISVLSSYFLNRLWVFKREAANAVKGSILRFFASYIFTSYILTNLLNILWVEAFSVPEKFAPVLSVILVTPINFFLSKYFSFRGKRKEHEHVQ
ncbi:MAG: GtrA family protein [Clostridiaceae bacterium]|nr:GtrA family protein [Clostridiaceae bacterium]